MARFRIDGVELEAPEHLRIGEVIEAEKALGFSMDSGWGAQMAVTLFIAMRNKEPEKPATLIASEVLQADMSALEEVEESPPADAPKGADPEAPPTSGALRSVNTA